MSTAGPPPSPDAKRKRYLTRREKIFLYWSQNGTCLSCNLPLGDNWDAHHIEEYARTRRTNVHEMQALHEECHIKLHREKRQHDGT